jgi:hypothetical protein
MSGNATRGISMCKSNVEQRSRDAPGVLPRTLGERLRAIRRRRGWEVRTAGKAIGVDGETWRLWEVGRTPSATHEQVILVPDTPGM